MQTSLANANPAYRGLSDAKNKVYALVPDYQLPATPLAIDGHAQPGVGQQIVIPDGMTDLPAGTYTLLPAEYALMKGGYRVEIGKAAGPGASGIARMDDGSIRLILKTRSEEHTSELQSLMRISYAVFCLKTKKHTKQNQIT